MRGVRSKLETARCMHSRARDAKWIKSQVDVPSVKNLTSSAAIITLGHSLAAETPLEKEYMRAVVFPSAVLQRAGNRMQIEDMRVAKQKRRGIRVCPSIPYSQTVPLDSVGAKRKNIGSAFLSERARDKPFPRRQKRILPGRTLVASSGACHQS